MTKKFSILLIIFEISIIFATFNPKTEYIAYNYDEIPFKYRKNIISFNDGEIKFQMPSEFRGRVIFKSMNSFKVSFYRHETCQLPFEGGIFYEGGTEHPFEVSYGSGPFPECTWRMYWWNFYDGLTYKTSSLITAAKFDGNDEYVKGFNGPTNEINPVTFSYDRGRNMTFCGGKWSGNGIFYGVYTSRPCISLGMAYNETHRIYNIIVRKLEPKCKHEITISEGMFLIFSNDDHPNTIKGPEPFNIPKWPPGNRIYVPLQFEGIFVAAISFATVPLIAILFGIGCIILTTFIKIPYFYTKNAIERSEEKKKEFEGKNKKKWQKYKETRKDFREIIEKSQHLKPSQPHGYEFEDEPIKMRVDWKDILDSDKKELDRIREYYKDNQKLPKWLSKDVLKKDFEYPPPIDVKLQKKLTTKAPLFTSIAQKVVIKVEDGEVSATKEKKEAPPSQASASVIIKDISKAPSKVASKKGPDVSKKMSAKETQKATEPTFETEAEAAATAKKAQTDVTQDVAVHTVVTQEENPEDAMNI
uniref:Uncharacterized protein n=1 Tax=Panagrolaimus superbus TaxID=310955 RepID=A0A914XUZ5_9BILA